MNILLIDDHPMTVEGFMSALLQVNFNQKKAVFTKANDAKEGYNSIIKASETFHSFNLAIIDQSLPSYPEKSIASGSDLALLLREKMPNCKIIIVTAHTEVVVVYDIAKNIRPDGLIIKNDINPDNLQLIVAEVLQGKQYQSPMVKNCIQEIWRKELMIEDSNRQILLCLSRGFKIKELESIVNLTSSAIQKRIIRMKKAFDVTDDTGLIKEAVKQGFI
jgi:DNA-binding NarL/FixJ family response regulator